MEVYFTTVVRAASQEQGGELVRLDWNTKRVLATTPMVPANPAVHDPNPRGSTRGGRGVLVRDGEVFAASYHTIEVFDRFLHPTRAIQCSLFAGLHELAFDGGAIWASATSIDHLVKVTPCGQLLEVWSPRNDHVTSRAFGLPNLILDPAEDHRTGHVGVSNTAPGHVHLNAIALKDGRPLALLNRFGCIVRLNPTEVLVTDPSLVGCHNIVVGSDDTIFVNDTRGRTIRRFREDGTQIASINLLEFSEVQGILSRLKWRQWMCWLAEHGWLQRFSARLFENAVTARPLFVRGLCETERGTFLVGVSPAAILEIDVNACRLVDTFVYSTDVRVCIHGIACTTRLET